MIVRVDNRIRLPESELEPAILDALKEAFTRKNPMFWKLRRLGKRVYGEEPEVKCFRSKGGEFSVGRGAWVIVRDILRTNKIPIRIDDARCSGEPAPTLELYVLLRDYQEKQFEIAMKRENCLLRTSTGGGKTTLGLALAAAVPTHVLILVDTEGIADEWIKRSVAELRVTPALYGWGVKRTGRITVASHASVHAAKPEEFARLAKLFGCVIADEAQILGAKTYGSNVDRFPAKWRFGVTDDHHRIDGKTFKVTDLLGPVADHVKDKELLAKGALAESDVLVDPTNFLAPWYAERPKDDDGMPIPPSGEEFSRLLDEMVADDRRSSEIATRIAAEVAKGKTFLVTSHRTEHCRILLRMLEAAGVPAGLMLGGTEEFKRTHAGLLSGLVKAGVGTFQALGKGINLPDVGAGYAATPVATSQQRFRQAWGRVRRPKSDGSTAEFWVAWDRYVFGDAAIRKLTKWNRGRVRIAVGSSFVSPAEYAEIEKGKTDGSQTGTRRRSAAQ